MNGKQTAGINVGGASILVIFILLCLTTFATLSMVSARADLRLTEKAAAAAVEYYAADSAAEETLAVIDAFLRESAGANPTPEGYSAALLRGLPGAVSTIAVDEAAADHLSVHYAVPLGESRQLLVGLRIPTTSPGSSPRYTRTQWQVQSVGEWQPDSQGLDLWAGEGEGMNLLGDGLPPEMTP